MGYIDMPPTNQNEEESVGYTRKEMDFTNQRSHKESTCDEPSKHNSSMIANGMMNSLWSSDGLIKSNRLFERPSSTPPTHLDRFEPTTQADTTPSFALSRFALRESIEENNQEDEGVEFGRQSRSASVGRNLQRSWSAPPIPDNFDPFLSHSSHRVAHHRSLLDLGTTDELSSSMDFDISGHSGWNDCDKINSFEKTSTTTISPIASPLATERSDAVFDMNTTKRGEFLPRHMQSKSSQVPMSLVDRVQGDFPRTPSPVFGCSAQDVQIPQKSQYDHDRLDNAMRGMTLDDAKHRAGDTEASYASHRRVDRVSPFGANGHENYDYESRHLQRSYSQPSYMAANYFVTTPPGFAPPRTRGIYGTLPINDLRHNYIPVDEHHSVSHGHYPVLPVDYNQMYPCGPYSMGAGYSHKYHGSVGEPGVPFPRGLPHAQLSLPRGYAPHPTNPHYMDLTPPIYRSKSGPNRRSDISHLHPTAHSYSTTSLLEEFKVAGKGEKWDLGTISGHLVQFAREQNGSRFIQQRLEKADEESRNAAFDEIFPDALVLMMDVFGNYVIQKFFDHGSLEQHGRLVEQMQNHMIELALQVYGCRVIQKALEVSPVDQKLLLIRELRGHVMTCVVDQNGNHVLQKCIEAASWKKYGHNSYGQRHVTADDIQFIVNDFIGQVTVLSTHAYGCRVIQRVLEHCSPDQIRPIVEEIIVKCRELVKDQYGNYVVQHIIIHGERDQRDIVMQAIVPEIAKWSQHKYASNVVEACLEQATSQEICQIVDFILECDESGASCALLPMMKHMYGNYVVQKLLDKTDPDYRQRIINIIIHNADYLKRFTYGKHVLSRLERENNVRFQ